MTPVELLTKIASLVPPPKRPLLRLSGVLGPGSSWRPRVVPRREGGARHAHGLHAPPSAEGVDKKVKAAPAARAAAEASGAGKPALPVQTGDAAPQAGGKELVAPVGDAAPTVAAAGKEPGARSGLGSGVVRAQGLASTGPPC